MAYFIKRVEVSGFQSQRDISVAFSENVNFLIGRNGTGKTTFIRLLHAAAMLDLEELSRLKFSSITITFFDDREHVSPALRIRRQRPGAPPVDIDFRADGRSSYAKYIPADDDIEYPGLAIQRYTAMLNQTFDDALPLTVLRKKISENLLCSWLPILRSAPKRRRGEFYYDEEEPLNRKIRDLMTAVTSYLSTLDSRVSNENSQFQKDAFTSYLSNRLFDISSFSRLNIKDETSTLFEMFRELGHYSDDINKRIRRFFDNAEKTKNELVHGADTLSVEQASNVISVNALHKIVTSFQKYNMNKESILFPKTQFIKILNSLLFNKTARFDESNTLKISTTEIPYDEDDTDLTLYSLSSGERQLLVILTEALLQQKRKFVYLADEPELSLHVDWQSNLVRTIIEMNENAQIIFATHSPDIVSKYQDYVIDFEKL